MLHKPHRFRALVLSTAFAAFGVAVSARLVTLQVNRHEDYSQRAAAQQSRRVTLQAQRGDILDRAGRPLAQSAARISVYVHPEYLRPPHGEFKLEEIANAAARVGANYATVRQLLDRKSPVAIAKSLHPEDAEHLLEFLDAQGIDSRGYWMHRESKRIYPRSLAAAVIGFCSSDADGDNDGISGIELAYDAKLKGSRAEGRVKRTGLSQSLEPVESELIEQARGNTIVLTIDAVIQEAAESSLAEAVETFGAAGGCAVVMDVRTGEILALANYPSFDNNQFQTAAPEAMRNNAIATPLETGSVVKLFTAAILLDLGHVTAETPIDCEGGRILIGRRRITDAPGHAPLHVVPFRVMLAYSSNVGIVKAVENLDNETWYRYLRAFGMGQKTDIGLRGESAGILHPLDKWTSYSRSSLPMGYEVALTPVQIVAGIAALTNDGRYLRPRLVREIRDPHGNVLERFEPEVLRQVIRPTTSAVLRDVMSDVVYEGTAKKAQVAGYRIGGKTGTTVKSHIRDRKEYISSFCGVAPIERPAVAIYVNVDAPTKARFGGTIAAPVFARVARVALLQLGIPPTEPMLREDEAMQDQTASPMLWSDLAPRPAILAPEFTTIENAMPNLTGLTLAEVRRQLPKGIASVRTEGTGIVVDQSPMPGEAIPESSELFLHLQPDGARPVTISDLSHPPASLSSIGHRRSTQP